MIFFQNKWTRNHPRWYLFAIAGVALFILFYHYSGIGHRILILKCPFHSLTGWHCPGCGSQRAIIAGIEGNFVKAMGYNPLLLFGLLIAAYHQSIVIFNFYTKKNTYNLIYHPKFPIVVAAIVLLFWVLRNLPYEAFSWMAP